MSFLKRDKRTFLLCSVGPVVVVEVIVVLLVALRLAHVVVGGQPGQQRENGLGRSPSPSTTTSDDPPAVGDAAAVPSHPQTLLQVRREARGRYQPLAIRTLALLVFPLIVHLAKYVHAGLIHDFWGGVRRK